jgi:hypothetical protein
MERFAGAANLSPAPSHTLTCLSASPTPTDNAAKQGKGSGVIFAIFARALYRKRMARRARVEYPGALFHVITRGNQRQMIFRDLYTDIPHALVKTAARAPWWKSGGFKTTALRLTWPDSPRGKGGEWVTLTLRSPSAKLNELVVDSR